MLSKICKRCMIEKPIEQYYVHNSMKDGRLSFCIECTRKRIIKHRFLNDSVREYDRLRAKMPDRKSKLAEGVRRRKRQHPEKYKAHYALNNAVRDGTVIKPLHCSACSQVKKLTGHHEDYSKPLEVIWLCHRCHAKHHQLKDITMAKTKTTKPKLATTQDNVATNITPQTLAPLGEQINLNLTGETIKTLTLLASAILFAAPAFATQANPQNIVALGDMFYRYAMGAILVNQPSDAVANVPAIPNTQGTPAAAPTFG